MRFGLFKKWFKRRDEWLTVKLGDMPVGATFWIGIYEFIVLKKCIGCVIVLLRDLYGEPESFSQWLEESNNFNGSNVDMICREFAGKIKTLIGTKNVLLHRVKVQGSNINREASILYLRDFINYKELLEEYPVSNDYWLATDDFVERDNTEYATADSRSIKYAVTWEHLGIRPYMILEKNINVIVKGKLR